MADPLAAKMAGAATAGMGRTMQDNSLGFRGFHLAVQALKVSRRDQLDIGERQLAQQHAGQGGLLAKLIEDRIIDLDRRTRATADDSLG